MDLNNLLMAVGLEALWMMDRSRRAAQHQIVGRAEWLTIAAVVVAVPQDLVLMFRYGIMDDRAYLVSVGLPHGTRNGH
jgi:hypothetical protein